jgi:transposase
MIPRRAAIYAAVDPVDMRRSFDGLSAAAREHLGRDPQSGALFLFVNRDGDRMKILWWDRNGFCILYKRLEQGTFAWPPDPPPDPVEMRSTDLALLLSGVDVAQTRRRRWYERVA